MHTSTFSIVARDTETGELGIAVASKLFAVGAFVPWIEPGLGALAVQSYYEPTLGPNGLRLLHQGLAPREVLEGILREDDGRALRQLGLVDAKGRAASYTGESCHDWAGHHEGDGWCCQGNLLVGEETLMAMAEAFAGTVGTLARRLLAALEAGDVTGGDKRGRQSAALNVVPTQGDRRIPVDLRVDDDFKPVSQLARHLEMHQLYFGSSPPEDKVPLEGRVLGDLQRMMQRMGFYDGAADERWSEVAANALFVWTAWENLEERIDLEHQTIDRPALDYLRGLATK